MSGGADEGGFAAEGLGFGFAGEPVLADIDLTVARGSVTAVLGPSGVGKTTLLQLIGGIGRPTAGRLRSSFRRPALVFQDALLLPWRTARGNVAFGLAGSRLARAERDARASDMLAKVGLGPEEARKYPHQLSGGMKKRAALARALAVEPDLLLLDEAFAALDGELARRMQRLVLAEVVERGGAVVLVTHDLAEAARLADEIVTLGGRPGRIVGRDRIEPPARLRDEALVASTTIRLSR